MKIRILFLSFIVSFLFAGTFSQSFAQVSGDNIKFDADLRYRHELIEAEGKEQRNRQRVRARVNMSAKLNDEVNIGFRIASGTDNPVSTNQTMGDGFSSKQAKVDLAFFEWNPGKVSGVSVIGGKVKNPFFSPSKTQLLWDTDLTPEGLAFKYSKSGGAMDLFVSTSYFWVEERSEKGDAILLGGQAGIDYASPVGGLIVGAGYFDYQNAKNYPSFYDTKDSAGNSADSTGKYLYDFDDLEIFAEFSPKAFEILTVFVDYVSNIAENVEDNQSWLAGFTCGSAKDPGSYDVRYSYRYIEKDSIIGAFTDSDFLGGGADGQGHKIDINYQLASKTKATATFFINQSGIENSKNYNRFQLAFSFKM
ncbi:putative porin [Candidatus Latescibacterota bacterium]